MLPRINPRGTSFKGITAYLLYGKIGEENPARVEWSMTGNLYTNDIEKAAKVMSFTAMNAEDIKREAGGSLAGAKSEGKPVYHQSLSWRVGDEPSEQHMKETALDYLDKRGLSNHEHYIVAHNDTDHKHLHMVVNLVDHETGKTIKLGRDKMAAQEWALAYEQKYGIQCELREKNAAKRERGEAIKHQDQKQDYSGKITRAYYASDNGQSFINALSMEGLQLAKARRGNNFVIVDGKGDIQKFARQLAIDEKGKAKTAAIQHLLKDIDHEKLKDASELSKQIKHDLEQNKVSIDREAEEVKQQNALLDAAEKYAQDQIKLDQKIEVESLKILNEKRGELFKQAKNDWREIKAVHAEERRDTRKELSELNELRLKEHNARWTAIIEADKHQQTVLQSELAKAGLAGIYFRLRYGKETQQEIENLGKNIANSQMRLDSGVIGKTGQDMMALKGLHAEQRQALKNRIDEQLKSAPEAARQEAEKKLLPQDTAEQKGDLIETFNKTHLAGDTMINDGNDSPSRKKWENIANFSEAETDAARAQQLNISVEALAKQDEAHRQALEDASKVTVNPISDEQIKDDLEHLKTLEKSRYHSDPDTSSPWLTAEQIAENVQAQAAFKPASNNDESFTDELKPEFKERLDAFNEKSKVEPEEENQSQGRGQSPDLD